MHGYGNSTGKAVPLEGPNAKKVKFDQISTELVSNFPSTNFYPRAVSDLIKLAFPNSYSKPSGHLRTAHMFGVEPIPAHDSSPEAHLRAENELLHKKIKELNEHIEHLEHQVRDLEEVQTVSSVRLSSEITTLLQSSHTVYHGPDTITHFNQFSIESILDEVREHAPNLFAPLMRLGRSDRLSSDSAEKDLCGEVRTLSSLCILLKSKCKKVLGLQLLVSFMLIARATNHRVRVTR